MKNHPTDASNQDILNAIQALASNTDILDAIQAFATNTEVRLTTIESRLTGVDSRLVKVESRLTNVDSRLAKVESTMVTKDYLDDKLADLKGELILLARKANTKLSVFIETLVANKVLKRTIADKILALEPFSH